MFRSGDGKDSYQGVEKKINVDSIPIRTEADYEADLKEVERLWGSEPGIPDGDRFQVLFMFVEVCEDKRYPILPPDPIGAIK